MTALSILLKLAALALHGSCIVESKFCYYSTYNDSAESQLRIECDEEMSCCGDIMNVYCCENDLQRISSSVIIIVVVVVGGVLLLAIIIGITVYCVSSMTRAYRLMGQGGGTPGIVISLPSTGTCTNQRQITTQAQHTRENLDEVPPEPESTQTLTLVRPYSSLNPPDLVDLHGPRNIAYQ